MDLPGPSTFGLLVDDLDTCHARAIDAGAAETVVSTKPDAQITARSVARRTPSQPNSG